MSESTPPDQPQQSPPPSYAAGGYGGGYTGGYTGGPVAPYGQPGHPQPWSGPVGRVRGTGLSMLLYVVTCGIYGWFWYYGTHEEMKRHSGQGIGGLLALLLGIFVGIVMVFLTPMEVGELYKRRGQRPPVSALTGLWILLPIAGAIVWFVKTNGALNAYWRSLGAV